MTGNSLTQVFMLQQCQSHLSVHLPSLCQRFSCGLSVLDSTETWVLHLREIKMLQPSLLLWLREYCDRMTAEDNRVFASPDNNYAKILVCEIRLCCCCNWGNKLSPLTSASPSLLLSSKFFWMPGCHGTLKNVVLRFSSQIVILTSSLCLPTSETDLWLHLRGRIKTQHARKGN